MFDWRPCKKCFGALYCLQIYMAFIALWFFLFHINLACGSILVVFVHPDFLRLTSILDLKLCFILWETLLTTIQIIAFVWASNWCPHWVYWKGSTQSNCVRDVSKLIVRPSLLFGCKLSFSSSFGESIWLNSNLLYGNRKFPTVRVRWCPGQLWTTSQQFSLWWDHGQLSTAS